MTGRIAVPPPDAPRRARITRRAAEHLTALLDDSAERFGPDARDRYAALLVRAMQDVADDPQRPGTVHDAAAGTAECFYHIRHGRARVPTPPGRVGNPRHVLVYEIAPDGVVVILGVLPDMIPREEAVRRFVRDR